MGNHEMPEKDPTTWAMSTWFLALGMAMAGGIVNWYGRVKAGHTRAFNVIELVGEMFTSGLVGVATYMLLEAVGQPVGVCAAAAGIGGHMGTRLLFVAERSLEARIKRYLDK
jgi:hypothetical protein